MFAKNQTVTLDITDINNLGCGVGKIDGMVFFVKGAVSGDRVEAKIIKVNKSYCVGRLERVTVPSPHRTRTTFCHAPEACGGCVYRHLSYAHEKEAKRSYVKNAFRKAGLPDVTVDEVETTGAERSYRNKAQYPFGTVGGKTVVGFYAGKTHKVIPCSDCALQPDIFGEICRFVCAFADAHGWDVYDEETGKGLLRHLYIREGKNSGEIMVCLVVNGNRLPDETVFADALVAAFPRVKSMMLNRNTKNTNVVLGREYRTLAGKDHIEDVLCGRTFRITPASFYQVNHDGAELLYGIAARRANVGAGETLLDLYCGIGTIGISMATPDTKLVGVEIVPSAVECAKENAKRNGLENAEFYCGDAGDVAKLVDNALDRCGDLDRTTVIVDPPRKGLDAALVRYLADKNMKKIVYVSCDPDTLARDCALFRDLDYEIGAVTPVDMFPKTGHVESVVCLSREKANEPSLSFRIAQQGDEDQVLSLYQSAQSGKFCVWNDSYPSIAEIAHDLETNNLYVMTDGSKIIGAISIVPENELDDFDCWSCSGGKEIARVVIDWAYQGQGLSFEMVQRAESILREKGHMSIRLSVVKSNIPAYKTYMKAGFSVVGEAQMYGNDYYLMDKVINTTSLPKRNTDELGVCC